MSFYSKKSNHKINMNNLLIKIFIFNSDEKPYALIYDLMRQKR